MEKVMFQRVRQKDKAYKNSKITAKSLQKEVETYLKRHIEKELKLVCENIFEIVDQFVAQGSLRSCA